MVNLSRYSDLGGICVIVISVLCMFFLDRCVKIIKKNQFNLGLQSANIENEVNEIAKLLSEEMTDYYEEPVPPSSVPSFLSKLGPLKVPGSNAINRSLLFPQFHKVNLIKFPKCKERYKLIILVQSRISHFSQRMVIRNTWGKQPPSDKYKWKTFFLVARSKYAQDSSLLLKEYEEFDDLILGDLYEDFYTLSLKVEMGFEWSVKNCKYHYLLKGDDDIFINTPTLFEYLNEKTTPKTKLYTGYVQFFANVLRNGRYGVPVEEYPKKIYPRYCSGGGFVVSNDVVEKMVTNIHNVVPMKIDDAYVGELALKSGVDLLHNEMFRMYEPCTYNNSILVHHPVKTRVCMEKLFESHVAEHSKLFVK